MTRKYFLHALIVVAVAVGCNRSEPQAPAKPVEKPAATSSTLPPGHPPLDMSRQSLPPGAGAEAPNPQWTAPSNWTEGKPGSMRRAQFAAEGAEIVVSAFPGNVGGLPANINRWRGQIGLGPVAPEEVAGMTSDLDVAGAKATVVDFRSEKQRMIVVTIPHEGDSWFFKITGDIAAVETQKEAFLQFVKSVKF